MSYLSEKIFLFTERFDMFTGIVETKGIVRSHGPIVGHRPVKLELHVPKFSRDLRIGGSLAVNGVCLTVIRRKGTNIFFDVVRETLKRSTLGSLKAGDAVNLERPMKLGRRLEGHIVLGHVDAVGRIQKTAKKGNGKDFFVLFPAKLKPFILEKGSIAVDGVSLTLGKIKGNGFWVHIIPHTLKSTNFGNHANGTRVNLEADFLLKSAVKKSKKRGFKLV